MSEVSDEVKAQAREIGWRPQEEFRGDPAKWVDADEYIRRGEEVLPLVKAENRRLHDQLEAQRREVARLASVVSQQAQSMEDLKEFSLNQLQEKLNENKRSLKTQLREARREDNDQRVEELEEALEDNTAAQTKLAATKEAVKTAPKQPEQTQTQEAPEFAGWKSKNPWFQGSSTLDKAKTAAAMAFATEVANEGKRGQAFYDAIDERLAEAYPPPKKSEKTEDGRPGGGGSGSSSSSASGFNALPADAKAKAKEQAGRFVGPNKMFKTNEAWFDYYAKQYNTEAA